MKKNTMRAALLVAFLTMTGYSVKAQNKELKIGTNPTIKEPSAVLEVESTNKGMLMPRVTLTSTTDATTIATPANALTVFNTATAGTAPEDVTPGYYYWSTTESKWIRLLNQNDVMEPWNVQGTTDKATNNNDNIYQTGSVSIGASSAYTDTNATKALLDVAGATRIGVNSMGLIGANSVAIGDGNEASGLNSIAFGAENIASGINTFALGVHSEATGYGARAIGEYAKAKGALSTALGLQVETNVFAGVVVGENNAILDGKPDSNDFTSSNNAIFQVGNSGRGSDDSFGQGNALTVLRNGNTGIGIGGTEDNAKPTERLDIGIGNSSAADSKGSIRIRAFGTGSYQGDVTTDNVVVADADGVLKTVPVSAIASAETNTTLSIAAGELVYTNEDANNANVNLISADADNTLVAGTDGRLFVPEPALENIYTTDGTLTSERTVTLDSKSLHFLGDYQKTTWSLYSGIIQEGLDSSPYNEASITLRAPDKDNDGFRGRLDLQSFAEGDTQIYAGSEATSLTIGTHATIDSAPLVFATSSGGGALATNKATITGTGEMGIATDDPTEKLDIGEGNLRVRDISANAGDATTDRVVVADADGVLKTIPASATTNIYNANGTLTDQRAVSMEDKQLTFIGDHQETTFSVYSGLLQEGRVSSPYDGRGSIAIYGADKNADNLRTALSIQSFADGGAQLYAYEGANLIEIGTNITQNAAPIIFTTSAGGFVSGSEKMRITGTGEVGIVTTNPTEKLDVGEGNVRVRDIVANAGNNSTDRIVVADADGVLKTIDAFTMAAIRTETTNYAAVATDETILVNAAGGTVTVTLPATPTTGKKYNVKKIDSTANTVTVSGNGHNIDGNTTVSGTLPYQGWVMQFDGTNWFIISRI